MKGLEAPTNLLCEYAANPLGIDVRVPRFSWVLRSADRGQEQTAFQVRVAREREALDKGGIDMWDSGKVVSNQSVGIEYAGAPLESRRRYLWKVKVWDRDGRVTPESEAAWFEMGLLQPEDWRAVWVGYSGGKPGEGLAMRHTLSLAKPVAQARAYISGLGYYELRINGSKVGDHVLDPGWTDYSRTVLYVTYDVTPHLRSDDNVVGIVLGNGWYGCPRVLVQLNIRYQDGSEEVLWPHDWFWQVTSSPIVRNSIHDGEEYDARLEKPGWDSPGFTKDPREWVMAQRLAPPGGTMKAQMAEPIKVVRHISPVQVCQPQPGVFVYDLGQNIAGWCILKVKGVAGTVVTLKFGETLYEDGAVNQENLRAGKARLVYTLKGVGEEVYEPRFTYFGFRYVEVTGFPGTPDIGNLTGCVVRNSVDHAGEFSCSDKLINQIQQNVVRTEGNNLHWAPTDCPQRNERMGWLNDVTVRIEESLYNYNLERFFTKWMRDIRDTQDHQSGAVADTAPYRWGNIPADSTAISYVLLPWYMYLHYGDRRILEEYYDGIKGWADYLHSRTEGSIVDYCWYGDWCSPIGECWPPEKPGLPPDSPGAVTMVGSYSAKTPGRLMGTGHLIWATRTIAAVAAVLGKNADANEYDERAKRISEAFNRRFLNGDTAQYAGGSQCSQAFPLFLNIVPESRKEAVLDNLVRDIQEGHQGHLSTGNHGTKFLMEVLTDLGQGDVAYKMATQTSYPSWGFMISLGATTNWERWEYMTGPGMNSHDHPCLGNVSAWFYKRLAGINVDPKGPGWKRAIIRPFVLGDLQSVNARLNTIRGLFSVQWERLKDGLRLVVAVPVNSQASVSVPTLGYPDVVIREGSREVWAHGAYKSGIDGILAGLHDGGWISFTVSSGTYKFEMRREQ